MPEDREGAYARHVGSAQGVHTARNNEEGCA